MGCGSITNQYLLSNYFKHSTMAETNLKLVKIFRLAKLKLCCWNHPLIKIAHAWSWLAWFYYVNKFQENRSPINIFFLGGGIFIRIQKTNNISYKLLYFCLGTHCFLQVKRQQCFPKFQFSRMFVCSAPKVQKSKTVFDFTSLIAHSTESQMLSLPLEYCCKISIIIVGL